MNAPRGYDPHIVMPMVSKLLKIPAMMNTQIHYMIIKKSLHYSQYVRQAVQEKIERDAEVYPEVLHLEPVHPRMMK